MSMKQKVFTFTHSLNRGIHSSPSKIRMRNSVIQALLTRIATLNKGMCDLQLVHTNDFSIIWSINYNAIVIRSNSHCDLIKQSGETVSAG